MVIGLRKRMLMVALLPATAVAVLLTAFFQVRAIDVLEQQLRSRGEAISRQMATAAEFGIFSGQRAPLLALTESTLRIEPEARGATILDARHKVIVSSGESKFSAWPEVGKSEVRRIRPDVLLFVEPVRQTSVAVDDIYSGTETARPGEQAAIGYAVLELSLQPVADKTRRLVVVGILIALLGAGLGGWLARNLTKAVMEPLLDATEVVERIGKGDLTARAEAAPDSPLQALAAGINHMAERVSFTQEELIARVSESTLDLLRQKEAAEHATVAKSHFLAAASHDLRQPLHALGLFVSGLAQSEAARQEPKLVSQIQSAVQTLQNLLDAILDVSRLDGGNVVPRIADFPMGKVLDRLVGDLSLQAQQNGLRLRVRPIQVMVRSDEMIIRRILVNLVGNALRYTRAGGVLVSCRRRGPVVRVEVWDTGEGIPETAREEIFDEYFQLGNPERDQAKGLGLGLAICRRLAGLLGMPMGLRSRPGRGSVFWIELPIAHQAQSVIPPIDERAPAVQITDPAALSGTVLVVEGDPLVRASMERAISGWGARVVLADNRADALRQSRESDPAPDLAVCNFRLPGMVSGIRLAQELQSEFKSMAVLLVSADVDAEVQTAARNAGYALLKEPVPPGRLRAALQHLLPPRS